MSSERQMLQQRPSDRFIGEDGSMASALCQQKPALRQRLFKRFYMMGCGQAGGHRAAGRDRAE